MMDIESVCVVSLFDGVFCRLYLYIYIIYIYIYIYIIFLWRIVM